MSELPGEALTYQTVVAEYFLGVRGGGLMLSPLDVELVRSWERRGLPVAVVCRGLRRGIEDALQLRGTSAPAPRSLRAYRFAVEDEWTAYRHGRVGDAPPPPDEQGAATGRLEAARALIAGAAAGPEVREPVRAAYFAAGAVLARSPARVGIEPVDRLIQQADVALLRAWLAGLPRQERDAIGVQCTRQAGPRRAWIRRVEYRALLLAYLTDAARKAGLLCLRGSV